MRRANGHSVPSQRSIKRGTTRREFGRLCAGMMAGSIGATMMQLRLTRSLLAQSSSNDYKALVCLFLDGGNDSFNMVVPHDQSEYDDYESIRVSQANSGLAIDRNQLLQFAGPNGRTFGFHPSMTDMQTLYNQNKVAVVANVGSLIQPTTMTDYEGDFELPLGLFSHADLTRHWQTSVPQSRAVLKGWGGRMADILTDPSERNATISMNIAMNQLNTFQSATYANPYVVSAYGATERDGAFGGWAPDEIFFRAHTEMLARQRTNLLEKTLAEVTDQAINAASLYNDSTNSVTFTTPFPSSDLANDLQQVAKTIAARETLGHSQQIFFLSFGGWDHHGGLIGPHGYMLGQVSEALKAFYDATVELGVDDKVVTFTASDFARTLAGNGQGSDHGWGGNQLVMGGAVAGGQVFGEYPASLAADNPLDVGRGRLIPTMSVDEYAAELALWMGIGNDGDLETILPNIRNFYDASETSGPVGFLV